MRERIPVGGGHEAFEDDGFLDVAFSGLVEAGPMRTVAEHVQAFSLRQGVGEPWSVVVVDITKLTGFTPEARKVLASMKPARPGVTNHTSLVVTGATLKTKALFALVLAAARLIGETTIDVEYCATREEGLARARRTRDELRERGLIAR